MYVGLVVASNALWLILAMTARQRFKLCMIICQEPDSIYYYYCTLSSIIKEIRSRLPQDKFYPEKHCGKLSLVDDTIWCFLLFFLLDHLFWALTLYFSKPLMLQLHLEGEVMSSALRNTNSALLNGTETKRRESWPEVLFKSLSTAVWHTLNAH